MSRTNTFSLFFCSSSGRTLAISDRLNINIGDSFGQHLHSAPSPATFSQCYTIHLVQFANTIARTISRKPERETINSRKVAIGIGHWALERQSFHYRLCIRLAHQIPLCMCESFACVTSNGTKMAGEIHRTAGAARVRRD